MTTQSISKARRNLPTSLELLRRNIGINRYVAVCAPRGCISPTNEFMTYIGLDVHFIGEVASLQTLTNCLPRKAVPEPVPRANDLMTDNNDNSSEQNLCNYKHEIS